MTPSSDGASERGKSNALHDYAGRIMVDFMSMKSSLGEVLEDSRISTARAVGA